MTNGDETRADVGPDDGIDPRRLHDRRRLHRPAGRRGPGRKALQLCEQVRDALPAILGRLSDGVLQGLTVLSVQPAPHSGRLMATVAVPATADAAGRRAAEQHLVRAAGRLRVEVAAVVHRRHAPELAFRVV